MNTFKKFLIVFGIVTGTLLFSAPIAGAANNIFQNGGRVGVATTTPWGALSVSALSTNANPLVSVSTTTAANATSTAFQIDSNGRVGITNSAPGFPLDVNGPVRLNGLVGIGTNPATFTLTVRNTAGFATNVTMGSSAADFRLNHTGAGTDVKEMLFRSQNGQLAISSLLDSGSFNIQNIMVIDNATGKIGLASTTAFANFAINPVAGMASNKFAIGSSTGTSLIVTNSSLVGTGTTTPFATLSVNGSAGTPNFVVGSSTGTYFIIDQNGNIGISTSTPGFQFSVGSTTSTQIGDFAVDSSGNQYGGGGKPSVSCAGTCTLDANAHDSSGIIFLSGIQTSVTLTFYTSKPWAPHCVVSDNVTTGTYDASSTPTQLVMGTSASLGTASISYKCQQ